MSNYDELKKAAECQKENMLGPVSMVVGCDTILNLLAEREKLQTEKDNAYTLLERMTQDKDCAWQNVHILERERQKQDARVEKLLKVVEAANEIMDYGTRIEYRDLADALKELEK